MPYQLIINSPRRKAMPYQLLSIPETRRLWMRGIGYSDWVEIDLATLFAL